MKSLLRTSKLEGPPRTDRPRRPLPEPRWRHDAELVAALVARDLKLCYARSALGLAWAIAHPAALVAAYALLLGGALRPGVENHGLFVLAGLLPWLWFSGTLTAAAGVFPANASMLRQSAFPSHLLVVAAVTSQFIHFLISLLVLLPLLAARQTFGAPALLLPALFLLQGVFTLGLALAVGTGNALWRDVGHILSVLLRVWFFATPILYVTRGLPHGLHAWLAVNPMAGLVQAYQAVLYWGRLPDAAALARTALGAAAALTAGVAVFQAGRARIPEEV